MTEIQIEVAYAGGDRQVVIPLAVQAGTTIGQAVRLSGIGDVFPDTDFTALKKGVWNVVKPDDHVLLAHDRVEIYRPLLIDPKEARRRRARKES